MLGDAVAAFVGLSTLRSRVNVSGSGKLQSRDLLWSDAKHVCGSLSTSQWSCKRCLCARSTPEHHPTCIWDALWATIVGPPSQAGTLVRHMHGMFCCSKTYRVLDRVDVEVHEVWVHGLPDHLLAGDLGL